MNPLVVDRLAVRLGSFHLKGASFTVEPGQITALLGHNGAGKTTILRLIMGLVRKDAGTVSIGGLTSETEIKRRVGFVPEEASFYERMTVSGLLEFTSRFYPGWNPALCARLLDALSVDPRQRLGTLSKGVRMKVSLVAALAHRPEVLLLDEPTSGLDPRSRAVFLTLLRAIAVEEGCAVLLATHNLNEVERTAARIVIVERGRIVENASLPALRERGGESWSLERHYLELVP